ncbi:RING/U-box superfamily protein [Raphanus sativus]|nr:RING/U-box superfamily protein [Raphanus sativus]
MDSRFVRGWAPLSDAEYKFSFVFVVLFFWLWVEMAMLLPVNRPTNVCIGPNSSILVEPNSIFVKSVKVEKLDGFESGLELFGFYTTPRVDVANWSESRVMSPSQRSYKGWPYYLNRGASLNISYNVKPEGCSVRLVVEKGVKKISVTGSGVIQVNIIDPESYHLNVANPNLKDVEVELDIDVRAVVYDTKEPPF